MFQTTTFTATTKACFAASPSRHVLLLTAAAGLTIGLCMAAQAADTHKEAKLDIAAGGSLNLVNRAGSVTLHSGTGHQVVVSYTVHSDKVEVDQNTSNNKQRVELRTHALPGQKPTADEAKVDYDVTVPAGISVNVTTASAPITADSLSGDIGLSSETGQINITNIARSHLRVRSITASVGLANVTTSSVDIQSAGGPVQLRSVTGQRVSVGTTSGDISYRGDCSGGGDYLLTTHSGTIDMTLPATASVDLTARSTNGTVDNAFPMQEKPHHTFPPQQGRSFAGTSNSGLSSVELQSFSGKIRVKKRETAL
jgi:DUF4097 and DUF4098 domain-containing protein YvlB